MNFSPYDGVPSFEWKKRTIELISLHPLSEEAIVTAVLNAWDLIHGSAIGNNLIIGENYFPTPQILGDYLHELIPIELSAISNCWRKGISSSEKDVVFTEDDRFSFEIKTSSQKGIYGNRSYAQKSRTRKSKSGYYLAINFPAVHTTKIWKPVKQIRFGWLDEADWQGQAAPTGQQASLSASVLAGKLITLYP